jgi:hypothetical protein
MTPLQILLINLTIALFAGVFSHSTKITNPKASDAFGIISGLAVLATPVLVAWCIMHYVTL